MELIPTNIPNQSLFCSSASDTDSTFYHRYAEWSKQMFLGNPDYFVASLDCEVIINATNNGKKLLVPLLSRDKVDSAIKTNPTKAQREYYNKFDNDGGVDAPFKRSTIMHNSVVRKPLLCNEDNTPRKFIFAYDPARSFDNSIFGVGELIEDEKVGLKLKIQNVVNFALLGEKKKRTNMRTPEQIKEIKDMLVKYNGKGFADYENMDMFLIDSGAGGGGVDKADEFMEDWVDNYGDKHRGLIDAEECSDYVKKFPNAVNKLKLVSPKKYRTEMFDALKEMLDNGLIEFTDDYDLKGYIMIPEETDEEIKEVDEATGETKVIKGIEYKKTKLSWEEELALKNIDLMKEEAIAIRESRNKENTTHSYALAPEKANKMHDDRIYVLSMMAWRLKQLRRSHITNKKPKKSNILDYCSFF